MSALDRPKIEDAARVIEDAENMLSALCSGKRFEMCVPVQPTDTDVVIGNALYIARRLLAELDQSRNDLDQKCKIIEVYEDHDSEVRG